MKGRIRKIIGTLCLFGVLFQVAFGGLAWAADSVVTVEGSTNTATVSGTLLGEASYATLVVLYPGKTLTWEYDATINFSDVVFEAALIQLEDGRFSRALNFWEEGPFGQYTIRVAYEGEFYETYYRYTKTGEAFEQELKEKLNAGADILDTLLEYEDMTLLDRSWFEAAPQELIACFEEEIKKLLPVGEVSVFLTQVDETAQKVRAMDEVNKAADTAELVQVLEKNKEILGLLFDVTTEEAAPFIEQILEEKPYYTVQAFEEMNSRYILQRINAASWGAYRGLIEQYPEIGILDVEKELNGFTAGQEQTLFGNMAKKAPFDSLEAFRDEFYSQKERLADDKPSTGGSSGGSAGGGGGGSGSGGAGVAGPLHTAVQTQPPEEEPQPLTFSDLEQVPWAQESIAYLAEEGVISGIGDGKFDPMGQVKREEFIKMMLNAFRFTVRSGYCEFLDVEQGAWYENYIYTAYSEDLVNGISEEYFGVGQSISRQDAAVLLTRVIQKRGLTLDVTKTADAPTDLEAVAEYAADAVKAMYKAGVLSGNESGEFQPQESLTRAQAAKMIYGALNSVR